MEKKELNKKVFTLFAFNLLIAGFLAAGASALGFQASTARINNLEEKFTYLEEQLFELEAGRNYTEENIKQVYAVFYDVSSDLNEYYYSGLISEKKFTEFQEKLITLTTIFLKSVESNFPDKKVVYFFCTSNVKSCEYEGFVLDYLGNKYEDVSVFGFNTDSNHPFIKLIFSKNSVKEVPVIMYDEKIHQGFLNLKELKTFLEITQ